MLQSRRGKQRTRNNPNANGTELVRAEIELRERDAGEVVFTEIQPLKRAACRDCLRNVGYVFAIESLVGHADGLDVCVILTDKPQRLLSNRGESVFRKVPFGSLLR
eukprot:1549238-Prymnesium_polylepis.1